MAREFVGKISSRDLEVMISTLEVQFVWLSHCLVSPGFRLEMGGTDFPGIHYNLKGEGRLVVAGREPVDLKPHTLVVVPPNSPFRIEVPDEKGNCEKLKTINGMEVVKKKGEVYEFVAGDAKKAEINLVCGFFKASYGQTTDLFAALRSPIIEKFGPANQIEVRLKSAVAEFLNQELGAAEMSGTLLKQVIILLLRRSLLSMNLWAEQFSTLRDPRVARAFAAMVADPGGDHSLRSLAETALLSRSAFAKTFSDVMGNTPMAILRDLRMRHAANLLKQSFLSLDHIARESGYDSKTSFTRTFKQTYGVAPADYRKDVLNGESTTANSDAKS